MFFLKLKSRFQRGGAARDVATLTVGTVIAQGITIAVTPLLTRLYSPSDFGLLAVFLAVVSVGATLVTLRYETSILVPKENNEAANLVLLSLIVGGGLSVVLIVLSSLLPMVLQEKLGLGSLGNWISIAFLTAGITSVIAVMQGWMNRQKKYTQLAWLRVGQSTALAFAAVFLGVMNVSDGLLIAQACINVCLCLAALWLGRSAANLWKQKQIQTTAILHKNAPKYLLPTALLDVVTLQTPVLLIATWFGSDEAGKFSMAWRLLMIPTALIGGSIGQVFIQRLSSSIDNPSAARKIFRESLAILFSVGLVPFALILMGGDVIFEIFLGEKWLEAGSIAMILAPMAFSMFISSPTSGAYIVLGLQKYGLFFGFITLIYRPLCIYLGNFFNNLALGLSVWVVLEVITIVAYQYLIWRKLSSR